MKDYLAFRINWEIRYFSVSAESRNLVLYSPSYIVVLVIFFVIQEVIQQDTTEPIEEDMVEQHKPQEVEEIVEDDDEARSEATFRYCSQGNLRGEGLISINLCK